MATAGSSVEAARVSGERIATQIDTADSAGFTTTETAGSTVTAALVAGRTYRVTFHGNLRSSVSGDSIDVRIREDSTSGTGLQRGVLVNPSTSAIGFPFPLEAEYVAVATGNKTFVCSAVRAAGTGTVTFLGAADKPRYLYVDYVRG